MCMRERKHFIVLTKTIHKFVLCFVHMREEGPCPIASLTHVYERERERVISCFDKDDSKNFLTWSWHKIGSTCTLLRKNEIDFSKLRISSNQNVSLSRSVYTVIKCICMREKWEILFFEFLIKNKKWILLLIP